MFADEAKIKVKGGDGGNGAVSFLHEKYREFGGPDGGNGGVGGDVIFKAEERTNTLYYFKTHNNLKAENGENGKKRKKDGAGAEDLTVSVPVGTIILDEEGNELFDLNKKDIEVVVAEGGEGGFGNAHFASSVRQAPRIGEIGIKGEEKILLLKLKLVADVGLVGLPNAGKSTFLSVVTKAKPKIANYPFTTIIPNLGVVEGFGINEGEGFVIADMPGLIEGAALGKGLGDEFLKHIERTRVLLHLIDLTSSTLIEDFETIVKELNDYNEIILDKPQIVVLTKVDILEDHEREDRIKEVKKYLKKQKKAKLASNEPYVISAVSHEGLKEVIFKAIEILKKQKEEEQTEETTEEFKVYTLEDVKKDIFSITVDEEGRYIVKGKKIERFMLKTDFSNPYSVMRLRNIMKRIGIQKELSKKGAKEGDIVIIANKRINYKS